MSSRKRVALKNGTRNAAHATRVAGTDPEARRINLGAIAVEVRLTGRRFVLAAAAGERGEFTPAEVLACARADRDTCDRLAVEIANLTATGRE